MSVRGVAIQNRDKHSAAERAVKIKKLHEEGLPPKIIAVRMGLTDGRVSRILKSLGIKTNPQDALDW